MAIRIKTVDDAVLLHGTPIMFPPHALAKSFCTGFGLELGSAAHNPFDLEGSVNGAPEEYDPIYVQSQIQLCGKYDLVDLICDRHRVPLPPKSIDYCVSSHVVEHFPNPIANFLEWNRILKTDAGIFIIIPKRDALEQDKPRPISTLDEIVGMYAKYGDLPLAPSEPVLGYSHAFVWTLDLITSLIACCNERHGLGWEIVHTEETDTKVGNGHTIMARKR